MQQVTRGQYSSAAVVQVMPLIDMVIRPAYAQQSTMFFLLLTRQRSSAFHAHALHMIFVMGESH